MNVVRFHFRTFYTVSVSPFIMKYPYSVTSVLKNYNKSFHNGCDSLYVYMLYRPHSVRSFLSHVCDLLVEMWGPWQTWSGCSVTCGEGVRERVRDCLLPSGGGMQCTGMVREQSHCSLEDCTGEPYH